MNKGLDTPVWQLTVGELLDFINPKNEPDTIVDYTGDKYVHGIAGIAKLFGVSKPMVFQYRKQGWIEPAIKQNGRKIICDAELALELFGKRK